MKLEVLFKHFRSILNSSFDDVDTLSKSDSSEFFQQNWLQANWEMIFENFLSQELNTLVVLDYYGEGAEDLHYSLLDGQEGFNRVSHPSLKPTHTIVCHPKEREMRCQFSGEIVTFPDTGLVFGELVSMNNRQAVFEPPFDFALLCHDPFDIVLPLADLDMKLIEISDGLKK